MTNYGVDFNGELFVNPQGFDVPVAFGYEHRQEDGFNFPDAFIAKGLSSGNANQPVSGGFEVDELYGELVYKVHEMVDFSVAIGSFPTGILNNLHTSSLTQQTLQ